MIIKQFFAAFTYISLLFMMPLSLIGCDKSSDSNIKDNNKTVIECSNEVCDERFSVLPADADITNVEDPTSYFLADIRQKYPDAVALYVGAYNSSGRETTIDMPDIKEPVILYLSSYSPIHWNINTTVIDSENNEYESNVIGVVYGSYSEGSQVSGVNKKLTFDHGHRLGNYNSDVSCSCAGGNFRCDGSDVILDIGSLQHRYGFKVIGYTGASSVDKVSFSNTNRSINFAKLATVNYRKIEAKKNQCTNRVHSNFEDTYTNLTENHQDSLTFYSDTSSYLIQTKSNAGQVQTNDSQMFDNHLYKFPFTTNTWGDFLNPKRKVPDSGYMAYYIDANNVEKVVKAMPVSAIQKKYAYDEFLGIPSSNLNAYWVGVLNAPKSEFYNILMNKSWSGGRVSIDRRVILEQGLHDVEQKVFIPKGNHIIEVEYSNSWHTTDVSVMLTPISEVKQPTDPSDFLVDIKTQYPNVVALYAGAYEADNQAVVLDIPKSTAPIVLYLGSYRAIKWQVNNPHKTKVVGVVYGSYDDGTKVQGVSQDMVINTGKQFGSYATNEVCHCVSDMDECISQGKSTRFKAYKSYNIPVVEFVGDYSTDYLSFNKYTGNQCS